MPEARFDPTTGKVYISDVTVGGKVYLGSLSLEMIPGTAKFTTDKYFFLDRKIDTDNAVVNLPASNEGINVQGITDLGEKLGLSINQNDEGISLNVEVK